LLLAIREALACATTKNAAHWLAYCGYGFIETALVHSDCRALLPDSSGGAVAYKTEAECASSLLSAARSQGQLTDLYEKDTIGWFNGLFRPNDYHQTFRFLPSALSAPTGGDSQKSQKSQKGQGSRQHFGTKPGEEKSTNRGGRSGAGHPAPAVK
jgi:hypothetical protein